jgi:3-dehydroquinate synthase
LELLHGHGVKADLVAVPAGEASKSLDTAGRVMARWQGLGLTRAGCAVAVGGGVIGDLAGFAAGCYMRGLPFVQVPTTLLAQVDSSVGGKTGVNVEAGKNYCGLFHQPRRVYIDVAALAGLAQREVRSGLAEVVKYGVIADPELFRFLEENRAAVQGLEPEAMRRVVAACCRTKAEVVIADEREAGRRRILNYGHTFGHAIESLSGWELSHGECVAHGMVAATALAERLGMLAPAERARHDALLRAFGLAADRPALDPAQVLERMRGDKKARGGRIVLVLPTAIGRVEVRDDVAEADIMAALEAILQ